MAKPTQHCSLIGNLLVEICHTDTEESSMRLSSDAVNRPADANIQPTTL
eukprot:CAMPEP_0182809290 /NCGR_PEP_ID=MMETSP0006_2-20121128/7104_1 /TAXON_ID=97485 /ORGANISM="Prymnesium parvum, Strain Texoma1" /LENGTH=48 /DNA_ID= /DNA_START= /DNA_END= /DNA_ORIENTATION=